MADRAISPRTARALVAITVCVLLALEWLASAHVMIDASEHLDTIYDNALPSVEEMAEVLDKVTELRREMRPLSFEPTSPARRREALAHARSTLGAIRLKVRAYERYPTFPDEPPLQERVQAALATLERSVEALEQANTHDETLEVMNERFLPATDAVSDAGNDVVRLNARKGARTAKMAYVAQTAAVRWTLWLMVTLVLLTLGLGFFLDRTARRAEAGREALISELDAFSGRVAHDLKGIVSPIRLAASVLRRDATLSETAQSLLLRIETATRRTSALVDGLLEFAHAGVRSASATADVEAAVRAVETTLRPLVESERAQLSLEVEPGLRVRASEGVVASIIQNLARNALLHLGDSEERSVELRAHATSDGKTAVLEVSDTGPGIPRDVLGRLFRPFERGPTSAPGAGLGLATVKRLAEGHGGGVEVQSTIGVGSTFRVRLPRAP